jgi:hypothetical protein
MEILRITLSLALLGALGAWAAACGLGGDPVAPGALEDQVSVHSVLVAGADTVMVVLTRTPPSLGPYEYASPQPLYGATVRISSDGETLLLVEQDGMGARCLPRSITPHYGSQVGCYLAAIPGGVRAGETYELTIETHGYGTIQGRATVPSAPALLEPVAHSTITIGTEFPWSDRLDPVPVSWGAVEPDHRLELTLRTKAEECSVAMEVSQRYGNNSGADLSGLDSASIQYRRIYCRDQELAESYLADLSLTLFDTAYARYLKYNGVHRSTPKDYGSAGVVGALGVFAGAATTSVPVNLQVRRGD